MKKQTVTQPRKPTHRLYRVIGEGENARWTPIGAAWPNRDGQGFNFELAAVPLAGRIVMRAIREKPESAAA